MASSSLVVNSVQTTCIAIGKAQITKVHFSDDFFLALPLVFRCKTMENHLQYQGFTPMNPRENLEDTQNTREIPWLGKTKENQNIKERKIRAGRF